MGYLLSVKPGDPWSAGLLVAYVVFHLPLQCQRMIYQRRWIPAQAGIQCRQLIDGYKVKGLLFLLIHSQTLLRT